MVGDYCNKSLRLKADRWNKAVQHADTKDPVLRFLDSDQTEVRWSGGGHVVARWWTDSGQVVVVARW